VGDGVADGLGHLLVALLEQAAGLVELLLDVLLLLFVLGVGEELGQLDEGVAAGLEDLGELVELDDELEAADVGGVEEVLAVALDQLLFLEVLGGAGLAGFLVRDDGEEAQGGVDEGRLAVGEDRDVEVPDLGEDGVLLVEVLDLGFTDLGEGFALDGGEGGLDAGLELLDTLELLEQRAELLLEAGERDGVGDRQDDAAQEFGTLLQQFQRIQQLQARIQSALTTVEREALAKVGESEVKDFNEKDAVFAKVWNFNVPVLANRQTTFINTALRLFAVVSDEEAGKARAAKDFKEEQLVKRDGKNLLHTADIRGFEFVVQFDQFAKVLQARRDAFVQLTQLLANAKDEEQKKNIQKQLDETRGLLEKGNEEMAKSVGYSITHNYEVEVLESKFVFLLNQEEVNQVSSLFANAQQQQAVGADAPKAVEAPKAEAKKVEAKK